MTASTVLRIVFLCGKQYVQVNFLQTFSWCVSRPVCVPLVPEYPNQVLFMNKTDILRKKIEQDKIQVRRYVPDYDKSNDFENVATCKFSAAIKQFRAQLIPMISFPSRFQKDLSAVHNSRRSEEFHFALHNSCGAYPFSFHQKLSQASDNATRYVGQKIYRADPLRW